MNFGWKGRAIAAVWTLIQCGCAGARESQVRDEFARARASRTHAEHKANGDHQKTRSPGAHGRSAHLERAARADLLRSSVAQRASEAKHQTLADYFQRALRDNPDLSASFERWQASVYRISRARRLPDPTISFGYFIRSIETRVGPQRARVSLQQAFPWPTKLTAGADAASAQARAMGRRFEAQALRITARVSVAYYDLWQLRATRSIHREHLLVLRGLSESVRARLATGAAMLADLQQIDLTAARLEDDIRSMDESELSAEQELRAALGARTDISLATTEEPRSARLPTESSQQLLALAHAHPAIDSYGHLAEVSLAQARSEQAERLPSFTLSADWVLTDKTTMPEVPDSGKDAVMVGAGVRVPLWQGSYRDSIQAAQAESRAQLAEQESQRLRTTVALTTTLSRLRDSARRVEFYRQTLVPQAEAVYQSVLGAYTVGRGTVVQTLLSQRDLLELRLELVRVRAEYARQWAQVEELVGRQLTPGEFASSSSTGETHD